MVALSFKLLLPEGYRIYSTKTTTKTVKKATRIRVKTTPRVMVNMMTDDGICWI